MYKSIWWYLRVLPVLHRPEVVDIGDLDDRYLNLFLNAYINRHAHTEYLKMIEVYSPLGVWHVFLYGINTNIYYFWSMQYRQYA